MTLAQIKPGHGGVIATVEGEGALRRHLLDMGHPMELFLRGYALSLRKDEAAQITMREESLI